MVAFNVDRHWRHIDLNDNVGFAELNGERTHANTLVGACVEHLNTLVVACVNVVNAVQ